MVRPYAMKGQRIKKRKMGPSEPEEVRQEDGEAAGDEVGDGMARGDEAEVAFLEDGKPEQAALSSIPGIPAMVPANLSKHPRVIFILERASLEIGKIGKNFHILNSDEHANYLRKHNLNPADYRPDIAHQALLSILDSPLNKAGRLQAVYVKTEKGVLFEVKPYVRMPRTFKRFCGLMLQLLQNLSITAAGKREKLLNVIKNPVTQYLPANSRRIGLSFSSDKLVQLRDYVAASVDDATLVFVVGAMAHGKINQDYSDDFISVSNYPLSASCCIGRICNALELKWRIL